MSNYDFSTLSPLEFEQLVRDLVSKHLGVHLESFKAGKDRGMDFRFSMDGGRALGQCKHYLRTGYDGLKAVCKNTEVPKVSREKPTRYYLATSVPLTPNQKDELKTLFDPWCKGTDDIFGQDDLNALLRTQPAVEKAHFKLWLPSAAVLERVVHAGSYARGSLLAGQLRKRISLFVPNASLGVAEKILGEHHYCIVSGIPGIGKTTLAEIICARHISQGYEVVVIGTDASQGLDRFSEDGKQLFYYDDFLGQTAIDEKLNPKEDSDLVRLIAACQSTPNKRLLMTTREYILTQAKRRYEKLNRAVPDNTKCIVALEGYTRANRARILYNHLFFNGVAEDRIKSLLGDGTHIKIVDHPNYNPRVIETMCDTLSHRDATAEGWKQAFMASLANPRDIWNHVFQNQIGVHARAMVIAAGSLPNVIALPCLETAWLAHLAGQHLSADRDDFLRAVAELDGTFILTFQTMQYVRLHNPSVRDFVRGVLEQRPDILSVVVRTAAYFEQLERLLSWFPNPKTSTEAEPFIEAGLRTFRTSGVGLESDRLERYATAFWCPAIRLARLLALEVDGGQLARIWSAARELPFDSGVVTTGGLAGIVKAVRGRVSDVELRDWVRSAVDAMLDHVGQEAEYEELIGLAELLSNEERREYLDILQSSYVDSMKGADWYHILDADDAAAAREAVERVAEKLGLDPGRWLADIDDRLGEIEARNAQRGDEDYDAWKDEQAERRFEEREIDEMFGTLIE